MSLYKYVRQQMLAEGPQHESQKRADIWVQRELAAMTSGELLDRISDALEKMLPSLRVEAGARSTAGVDDDLLS